MNASAPTSGGEPPRSGQRWPEGWTKFHVYLTDLDEVKPLADAYRPVIDRTGGDVPVPHQWLHATVASVECDAAAVPESTLDLLVERLRRRVGALGPFDLTVGPALASMSAIMLDTYPDGRFQELVAACVAAINETVDGQVGRPCGGPGHVSLSYRPDRAGDDAERGSVQNHLRDVRPGRTDITVNGVDLVRVVQSDDASAYTWDHVARIPLGGR